MGSTAAGSQDGGVGETGGRAAAQETPEQEGEAERGRGGGRQLVPITVPSAPPLEACPKGIWKAFRPRSNSLPPSFLP